jgi:hypothetical protein
MTSHAFSLMSLVLAAGALGAASTGCSDPGKTGSTGGATTTSTGGTSTGGSTTGGSTTGGTAGSGGAGATGGATGGTGASSSSSSAGSTCSGGAPSCSSTEDCPLPANDCLDVTCEAGCCGTKNKPAGQGCGDGDAMVCNAGGACVECLSAANCNLASCSGGTFTAAGTCDASGSCVAGAQTNCLATNQVCDTVLGCVQCDVDGDCGAGKTCQADHTCK